MGTSRSVWQRIRAFVNPPRETYETRQARPDGDITTLPEQYNAATDPRRSGGSSAIGG